MMAAVKDAISPALVSGLGADFAVGWDGFDRARFEAMATDGLEQRELKARIALITEALLATLPQDVGHADRLIRSALSVGGLQSWASVPVNDYVAAAMIHEPDLALPLLAALTERFSAEFAIRPIIDRHFEPAMAYLHDWTGSRDEHVRRLVSEGSRPRLPWAPVLRRFVADPKPTIELLDRLFDDESEYVRRSVANHLNDISKDHADLAVATAGRWKVASERGGYVARHGLRTLVKKGHAGALDLLGFDHGADIDVLSLVCTPPEVAIGDAVTIAFTLRAHSATRVRDRLRRGLSGRE